jgi:hypothetical protein
MPDGKMHNDYMESANNFGIWQSMLFEKFLIGVL